VSAIGICTCKKLIFNSSVWWFRWESPSVTTPDRYGFGETCGVKCMLERVQEERELDGQQRLPMKDWRSP
jgi:hypothetical protein